MQTIKVSDLMNPNVVTIDHDETLDVAEELMRAGKIHHLPVVESGRLVGMLAHSDILKAQVSVFAELSSSEDRAVKSKIMAKQVMSKDVSTASPNMSAYEAAQTLQSHEYSSLPIIEDDQLVGILTERDFLDLVVRALRQEEEVVAVGAAQVARA